MAYVYFTFYNIRMPARKAPPKKSEILEKEANQMESLMAMLRGQIDEERAKVKPKGQPHWVAAGDGPMGKVDPHGAFARKVLAKKKPPAAPAQPDTTKSPRAKPAPQKPAEVAVAAPPPSQTTKRVEIVVEPQGGKLWGNYCDSSCQQEEEPRGGSLWGPPPDEAAEARKFQEEIARLRGETVKTEPQEEDVPPIGAGGALWGAPPDEQEEQKKFQMAVARLRGETVAPPAPENESNGVGANLVERKKIEPTAFTYFDMLMNKDVMDGSRVVDKK